jgi:acid phosphatase type 7
VSASLRLRLAALLAAGAVTAGACGGDGADGSQRGGAEARTGGVVVWAVGDGADGGPAARRVAARIADGRVDRLLYLGDVYHEGTAADFARHYAPVYGRFARRTLATPGNHEWARRRSGFDPYWSRVTGRPVRDWSATRVGSWEVLDLNSEASHGARSRQLRWLRAHVRRSAGTCRIAFWHRPRYNAGLVHGDSPDVEPFWRALRGHAVIVANGHEHDMQRFAPRDGITEFVSGAGGHGHYPVRRRAGLRFSDATHDGALRLTLTRGRAAWAFVAADGTRLDAGTLRCRPG